MSCGDLEFSVLSDIVEVDGARRVVLIVPKNTSEKLISSVSFQKSRHSYSRLDTDIVVSSFVQELFSFHITMQREVCVYSWTKG